MQTIPDSALLDSRAVIVNIYGHETLCHILKVHACGTVDVKRLSDGQCFRASGLKGKSAKGGAL